MFCSCTSTKKKNCFHRTLLPKLYDEYIEHIGGITPFKEFRGSLWYRIAEILAENCKETPYTIKLQYVNSNNEKVIKVVNSEEDELICYYSLNSDSSRFIERFSMPSGKNAVPSRSIILKNLAELTITEDERIMAEHGIKSIALERESSFWYRMAYHCYREFGSDEITFHPVIEKNTGRFTVICKDDDENPLFRIIIPRQKVKRILTAFKDIFPNQHGLAVSPIPLKSMFKIDMNTELDLEIRPLIEVLQDEGESKFFDREELEKFRYGNLVYIEEMGILAELEKPERMARKFVAPVKMVLKKSQIPTFLNEFESELENGSHIVDASVKTMKIMKYCDSAELVPEAIDREWCWLSLQYKFGNSSISLGEILRTRKEGLRYLSVPDGWVDCFSSEFDVLDPVLEQLSEHKESTESDLIKVSKTNLFRLKATSKTPVTVIGKSAHACKIKNIFDLKPAKFRKKLKGLRSPLRNYQIIGLKWLQFLYENGFGGLLCDDMGLGKTHQVMALMLSLIEHQHVENPCLVVCPTTVLSHWSNKITEHAPCLKAFVLHGGQRDIDEGLKDHKVLLTSFGILRNDIEQLSKIPFSLVVFDEIQNVKNPQTIAYKAAKKLRAFIKIGVTGTPVENNLTDIKSLFDLVVSGYLGSDDKFAKRYNSENIQGPDPVRREELRKLIYPFTLRRLKKTVLDELPEKIEDTRTCSLSEDQVKLYRDVIDSCAAGMKVILKGNKEQIPYLHIFAVLNLLKQICDHPVLLKDSVNDYEKYQSGKWELFKELIYESIDSGQKIVIFSQYLKMITIIERFLTQLDIGYVTLTGSSTNRGEIISCFNNDKDCRCYIGSIRAGGTGIDLVAASIVIHYDRWWNAAREDQATDRVHRIGQKRSVQVFKLVTEGTLEEKIAAIIEKKRRLLESVVQEDDPGLLKTFSRNELLSMLSSP